MLAPAPLSQAEPAPKQTKLLGATVRGVGVITTVGVQNVWRWALIERPDGSEAHAFITDLKREDVTLPAEPQPYREVCRRVGYGLWEDTEEDEDVRSKCRLESIQRTRELNPRWR